MSNASTAIKEQEVKEQEVECNHKPGDVWADGCCTSKKNKQQEIDSKSNDSVSPTESSQAKSSSDSK